MNQGSEITCPFCGKLTPRPLDLFARTVTCAACDWVIHLDELVTLAPESPAQGGSEETLEGQRFGGCRLIKLIGRGGMGVVYEAVQESLNRRVAVKVLPKRLAADESFVKRFNRESGALAPLSHAGTVAIYDRGHEGEHYYFVLEFVAGKDGRAALSLRERLRTRPAFTVAECGRLIQQVAETLRYAHAKGVIHRDIKPSNVLLDEEGNARLVDFGIAHLAGGGGQELSRLTLTGDVLGTAGYLAPEQRQGECAVDARADVYSCGVMLYEMLAGRMPEGAFELPSELVQSLDARWDDLVMKALQRNPDRRFQTLDKFLVALGAFSASTSRGAVHFAAQPVAVRDSNSRTETARGTPILGKCSRRTTLPGQTSEPFSLRKLSIPTISR